MSTAQVIAQRILKTTISKKNEDSYPGVQTSCYNQNTRKGHFNDWVGMSGQINRRIVQTDNSTKFSGIISDVLIHIVEHCIVLLQSLSYFLFHCYMLMSLRLK